MGDNPAGIGGSFNAGHIGVEGKTDSRQGWGVYGSNNKGIGVFGGSIDSAGIHGLSLNHAGVIGIGVAGDGVKGIAGNGGDAGVVGIQNTVNGWGVYGKTNGSSGYGVHGLNTAVNGSGVYGLASSGFGIRGEGIFGVSGKTNSPGGQAGFFEGSVTVKQHRKPIFNGFNNSIQNFSGLTIQDSTGLKEANFCVDVSGHLNISFNKNYLGFWNQTSGSYTNFSDIRTKDNIEPISTILPQISQLQPSSYTIKKDPSGKKYIGFIAQEVEEVFPELVCEKDGAYGLVYDNFGVLAIKAIQEQQDQIESLKNQQKELIELIKDLQLQIKQEIKSE